MLKLTNSFYRYLMVTCESLHYKTHVRVSSQIEDGRERCGVDVETRRRFHSTLLSKKHTNTRKRFRIKIPPLNADEFDRTEQMSDSLEPAGNCVSHGGHFTVSTENETSNEVWQKGGSSYSAAGYSGYSSESPPDFRVWETIAKKTVMNNNIGSFKFKVVSYNVLAQYLLECHPYLYTDCSPRNLTWNVRAARLFDEIVCLAPDILCLQEVQVSHLKTFYCKLEDLGYCGVFKQKTGHRQDGCAIYFRRSHFELLDHVNVEFFQPELPILNRDNIGVIVKLQPRCKSSCPIVVATTHLLYNPKRTDVRLAQIQVFLAEIDRIAYYSNEKECGHFPIILTGDLNSTPDSAVIKLLDKGHVRAENFRDHSDWQRIGVTDNCQHLAVYLDRQVGKETLWDDVKIRNTDFSVTPVACPPKPDDQEFSALFNSNEIGHSLRLLSVYNRFKKDGREEASTFQDYWVTVDYIYFSCCSNLFLRERLRLPSTEECEGLGRLPNDFYASDHLALAAVFELTSPPKVKL